MIRPKNVLQVLLTHEGGQTKPEFSFALAVVTSASAAMFTGRSAAVLTALHSVAGLLP
jgi:hypothetical protein